MADGNGGGLPFPQNRDPRDFLHPRDHHLSSYFDEGAQPRNYGDYYIE